MDEESERREFYWAIKSVSIPLFVISNFVWDEKNENQVTYIVISSLVISINCRQHRIVVDTVSACCIEKHQFQLFEARFGMIKSLKLRQTSGATLQMMFWWVVKKLIAAGSEAFSTFSSLPASFKRTQFCHETKRKRRKLVCEHEKL